MGEEADRKVTEIEEARRQLEGDLRELEARMPAPLRSGKSLAGVLGGTALAGVLLAALRSRGRSKRPSTEVVVRIVRDDEGAGK